jgi:A/G-specific adenine glycosylase
MQELFLETNIRSALIHHFFNNSRRKVSDATLQKALEHCTPYVRSSRVWFAALMDYGSHLKRTTGNASKKSATYVKQSTFKGSRRQLRGSILRYLSHTQRCTVADIAKKNPDRTPEEVRGVLEDLIGEGLVAKTNNLISLRD